ncbi:MAG: YafY family protein [Chloroflexota bacterium]
MNHTATRLITLILLLQSQPGQKAADLAARLGVSVRTVHRYFAMLDEMGVPVYAERGPYGGFSLVRGYKLPPLVFTPEEAVALSLGVSLVSELWGQLYHEAAQGALARLENVLPDEQRHEIVWARRSLAAAGMHRADLRSAMPLLEKLRRAVREYRRVSMTYCSASHPRGAQRDLDPYALIHRWGWWYVVGYCHLRRAVRSFRLDRIQQLTLSGQVFSPPAQFDVHAYLAQEWQAAPLLRVRMRFAPDCAHLAQYGGGYWQAREVQPDGSLVVAFDAPDLYAAAGSVLAYGPAVTALDPPEVRRLVREWAQAALELYSDLDDEKRKEQHDPGI